MGIIKKGAIAIYSGVGAFMHNVQNVLKCQTRCPICALASLNTMDWPEYLLPAHEHDGLALYFACGMMDSKAFMMGRMPILRGNDDFKTLYKTIYRWDPTATGLRPPWACT